MAPRSATAATARSPSCSATPTSNAVAAEIVATGAASGEFIDRWRTPGDTESKVWEERFGQEVYLPLVQSAFDDALKRAGLSADSLDHVIVVRPARPCRGRGEVGARGVAPTRSSTTRSASTGNLGAAQPGFLLADVLERATPGQLIALVVMADGADVIILRTTDAIGAAQADRDGAGLAPVRSLDRRRP